MPLRTVTSCYLARRAGLRRVPRVGGGTAEERSHTARWRDCRTGSDATTPQAGMSQTLVFSFGSNSMAQLRARIQARTVDSEPAIVHGWARIFCMHSSNWGGGVASLVPDKSSTVKGAVVSLDPEQLSRLDVFEKGYSKQELTATIESPGNSRRTEQVIAYIADNPSWVAPPSESYLTAINLMLREHWDADEPIPILGWSGDGVEEKAPAWRHPGTMALGLRALCVEINARLVQAPLVVPRATVEIEKALAQVDIASTAALAAALGAGAATPALRQALAAGGGDEDEMLQVCRDLFGAHLVFVYGSLMSGFDNHHFIAASTRLMDEAATEAHFTLVASENEALEFPYALDEADSRPSDTLCALKGEVYLVDAAGLATLDWLEDHPDLYERRLTPIARLGEAAWLYVLASRDSIDCVRALTWQHPQVLPPGDWRAFKKSQSREN